MFEVVRVVGKLDFGRPSDLPSYLIFVANKYVT